MWRVAGVAVSKKTKSSPGKSARRKGHQFEREVAIWLRRVFPQARRVLEYHEADCKGVDIAETGRFRFQCKKHKGYAPVSSLYEIEHDAECAGHIPVLVTAGDSEPAVAVLPFEDFLQLLYARVLVDKQDA